MTSPDRVRPDSTQTATSVGPYYQNANNSAIGAAKNQWMKDGAENVRQNLFTKLLSGFTNVVSIVGDGIMAVIEAITGISGGTLGDLDEWSTGVVDGQNELRDRLDLVEDVSGYCSLYQANTITFGNNSGATNPRYVPWALLPVGAVKNARRWVYDSPSRGQIQGIRFDSYGIWQIDTLVLGQGLFTIGGAAHMWLTIQVIDMQTDKIFSNKWYYNEIPGFHRSHGLGHKVIIPEGERYIAVVGLKHSRSPDATFIGGDGFTTLSVDRMDIRTDGALNPPPATDLGDT